MCPHDTPSVARGKARHFVYVYKIIWSGNHDDVHMGDDLQNLSFVFYGVFPPCIFVPSPYPTRKRAKFLVNKCRWWYNKIKNVIPLFRQHILCSNMLSVLSEFFKRKLSIALFNRISVVLPYYVRTLGRFWIIERTLCKYCTNLCSVITTPIAIAS